MLLLDENLSYKLAKQLRADFPDTCHVSDVGLLNTTDMQIWRYAQANQYSILTMDADYLNIAMLKGCPPKIILLRIGNRKADSLLQFLLDKQSVIEEFIHGEAHRHIACLELH